jgi:hypothetical protein
MEECTIPHTFLLKTCVSSTRSMVLQTDVSSPRPPSREKTGLGTARTALSHQRAHAPVARTPTPLVRMCLKLDASSSRPRIPPFSLPCRPEEPIKTLKNQCFLKTGIGGQGSFSSGHFTGCVAGRSCKPPHHRPPPPPVPEGCTKKAVATFSWSPSFEAHVSTNFRSGLLIFQRAFCSGVSAGPRQSALSPIWEGLRSPSLPPPPPTSGVGTPKCFEN